MSQVSTTKLYNTFIKGLITEAGPLTYPENSTISENNLMISRKGSRMRRLGLKLEGSTLTGTYTDSAQSAFACFRWDAPDKEGVSPFLVLQVGGKILFYSLADPTSISTHKHSYEISLSTYQVGTNSPANFPCDFAAGHGYLFIVNKYMEPLIVTYVSTTNTLSESIVQIKIRDFVGIDDGLSFEDEPATLSDAHKYNLYNQGWNASSNPINAYYTLYSKYPGNNKQWWVGKDSTGTFDPAALNKLWAGNTKAPRGHYILSAWLSDRASVSGIGSLSNTVIDVRPSSVTFAFGRAFFVCRDKVYFSQILETPLNAGKCYQEADPTSEDISDLIATDGGVISIPELVDGIKLVPIGNGVMVFSSTGVWTIQGTQNGFTATDISLTKLSSIGVLSPKSVVIVDDKVFWWSQTGIQAFSQNSGAFGPIEGSYNSTDISGGTIHSFFFEAISEEAHHTAEGVYDPASKTITWMYPSSTTTNRYFYDQMLNFDVTLGAFYPYSLPTSMTFPHVISAFMSPTVRFDVTVRNLIPQTAIYICSQVSGGSRAINFSTFSDKTFVDWGTEPYESYMETGYELLQDTMRRKQLPVLFTYLKETETGVTQNPDGGFDLNQQSSCMMQVKWDWSDNSVANKWTTPIEIYRHIRMPLIDASSSAFDSGYPLVTTKHRIRGSGKAIQFRFSCALPNRNFELLGWSCVFQGNTTT